MQKILKLFCLSALAIAFSGCQSGNNITSLTWTNSGDSMGDWDGPAYVVYSKTGYNKASFDIALSKIKINMVRKSDKKWANTYLFLGANLYNKNSWVNCVDAGLCFSGGGGGWHLFYNRYTFFEGQKWWESSVELNPEHDYRLVLDTSQKDEEGTLSIFDLSDGEKLADSVTFELLYSKADGSTTAFYQDYSIDFPDDVKMDTSGNPSYDDWEEITLYNTNENVYVKNIKISNCKLFNSSGENLWKSEFTKDRYMWPNTLTKIKYPCVKISNSKQDYQMTLDIDMNE